PCWVSSIAATRSRDTSYICSGTTKFPSNWFSVTPLANNHHLDLSGQSQVVGMMPLSIRSCSIFCHFLLTSCTRQPQGGGCTSYLLHSPWPVQIFLGLPLIVCIV